MKIIVVPGHTRGSMTLLYKNRFLFTGDHLAWDRLRSKLESFDDFCWYSWDEQIRSMDRLAAEPFEWVIPGHGERKKLPSEEMKLAIRAMTRCVLSSYRGAHFYSKSKLIVPQEF